MEDLDGDVAVVPDVMREVDGGHAALSELALDAVPVGQCAAKTIGYGRHGVMGRKFQRRRI
jgi:hypothetical protein